MRVIAGEFRSRILQAPDSDLTRPTTDRARESLFNVLQHLLDFDGIAVLDLFAGSGALAIEAISRGAGSAVFVEKNKKAVEAIRQNIRSLKIEDQTHVVQSDALAFLSTTEQQFDLLFADPPYDDASIYGRLIEQLKREAQTKRQAVAVVEHRTGTVLRGLEGGILKSVKAGEATFTIFNLASMN